MNKLTSVNTNNLLYQKTFVLLNNLQFNYPENIYAEMGSRNPEFRKLDPEICFLGLSFFLSFHFGMREWREES